jgi:glycosyltransferase involved in cell wall biosynthesis
MKVLHVVPAVAPRYGGPSEAVPRLCAALQRAGVETLLASTRADGRGRLAVPVNRETEFGGARAIFFSSLPGEALKVSPQLASWLRDSVRRFDLVHVHSVFSQPSLAAGRACREAAVPYVVRPLGQLDRWSLGRHSFRKRAFLALAGGRFLGGAAAAHWTAVSEQAAAGRWGSLPGFVVPLGVDEALFSADAGARMFRAATAGLGDAPYVLFLSRLHPKKNMEALINAFASSGGGDITDARLVVAGDGEASYVSMLKGLAAKSAVANRILFTGWLSGALKLSALAGATLFVLPSLQENFGLAAAEAMACGVPVLLGKDVNLADDVMSSAAGWVSAPDAGALRSTLDEAMSSSLERRRRGEAARALAAARFRWSTVAGALAREYGAILSHRMAAA